MAKMKQKACRVTTRRIPNSFKPTKGKPTFVYTVRCGKVEVAYGGGRKTRAQALKAGKAVIRKIKAGKVPVRHWAS